MSILSTLLSAMSNREKVDDLNGVHLHDIMVKGSIRMSSIDVCFGKLVQAMEWRREEDSWMTVFLPPRDLSGISNLTLHIHCRRQIGKISLPYKPHQDVRVDSHGLISEARLIDGEKREWRQKYGGIEVIITVTLRPTAPGDDEPSTGNPPELLSTTERIIKTCPCFRILVIGKTGVGKSSLINTVFGVEKAQVSHTKPGEADIDIGITSEEFEHLILHDSRGFEPGEVDTVRIVEEFIQKKVKEPDIKNKLHAIWLCLEVPSAGSRIMETAVEEFLDKKVSGELGNVPVIAIFTKYDELVSRASYEIFLQKGEAEGMDSEKILELGQKVAKERLKQVCIEPFEQKVEDNIPHITVSTEKGYEKTIDELIKLTYSNVEQYVASEPSVMVAIAQQASPSVKIDGSIRVGELKYWTGLASGTNFLGRSLKVCLEVIHTDIVTVWNFEDPHKHLQSPSFHKLMYDLVSKLDESGPRKPMATLSVGVSIVGAMAGIITSLAGPAAPIVLPIAASAILAVWLYEVYRQSDATLRRLMAYIVDLILIMQNVFYLAVIGDRLITRRLIKFAFQSYDKSDIKEAVHSEINAYVSQAGFLERAGRDRVLEKIKKLIHGNRMEAAEMYLRSEALGGIDLSIEDEPW